ncbi:MAG TPA: plasmid pRiA4b ORF-3 family protein [Bacillota bacterium]|nr:plasmid pRiA4b ORF-3 family protein [Bacillota bacterium]
MPNKETAIIYQLKITLKDIKPPIWRRIQVPQEISFRQLHQVLQVAFDWTDSHLHEFECKISKRLVDQIEKNLGEGEAYDLFMLDGFTKSARNLVAIIGDPNQYEDDGFAPEIRFDESDEILATWLMEVKDKCLYTYDFGDDWKHEIVLEEIFQAEPGIRYPRCIKAAKEAPAEDSSLGWMMDEDEDNDVDGDEDHKVKRQRSDAIILAETNEGLEDLVQNWDKVVLVPQQASLVEWDALFECAVRFKELKGWEWMDDSHIFAVQDGESDLTGYCCVMGGGGEIFGLAVYYGPKGIETLLKTLEGKLEEQEYYDQQSLMVSFENRGEVDKDDYELIKSLGRSFRGRNQWPVFRSFAPGLFPWYLTRQEVLFFTRVLEQAVLVCQRSRENLESYKMTEDYVVVARCSILQGDEWVWEDTRKRIEFIPQEEKCLPLVANELDLLRRKKNLKVVPLIIEFDYMYFTEPIQDRVGQRPYFPYHALWIDHEQEYILDVAMVERGNHEEYFQEKMLEIIDRIEVLPKEIWVQRERAYQLLAPITQKLGIKLIIVPTLPVLRNVVEDMKVHFQSL